MMNDRLKRFGVNFSRTSQTGHRVFMYGVTGRLPENLNKDFWSFLGHCRPNFPNFSGGNKNMNTPSSSPNVSVSVLRVTRGSTVGNGTEMFYRLGSIWSTGTGGRVKHYGG